MRKWFDQKRSWAVIDGIECKSNFGSLAPLEVIDQAIEDAVLEASARAFAAGAEAMRAECIAEVTSVYDRLGLSALQVRLARLPLPEPTTGEKGG